MQEAVPASIKKDSHRFHHWTSHWVPPALLVQHIIKYYTCNLRVNTKPQNDVCSGCMSWSLQEGLQTFTDSYITFSRSAPPHPPDSNFLDHILTRACNAVMRKKDLWVWSGAEKSIKETCEIYERPLCFSSLAPACTQLCYSLDFFGNTQGISTSVVSQRAHAHVAFSLLFCRTASSLWWNLWMEAIWCSTFRSPGSLKSQGLVSIQPRSRLLSCSYTARESSTGLNQWAQSIRTYQISIELQENPSFITWYFLMSLKTVYTFLAYALKNMFSIEHF